MPYLTDKGRALYQHFLTAPAPRAFVLSPTGAGAEANGGYDPLGRALQACGRSSEGCRPYAVDDDVVWTAPEKSAPAPARLVTKTVRMDVTTSLGAFVSVKPDCSPRGVPKVTIAEGPTHGIATVAAHDQHPAFPANTPYAACNAMTVPVVGVTYTPARGYAGDRGD